MGLRGLLESDGVNISVCGLEPTVGDTRLMIDDDDDREREIYGRGGGFAGSAVGVVGDFGDLGVSRATSCSGMLCDGRSRPNSSVNGRGGGRSTIASRSCP